MSFNNFFPYYMLLLSLLSTFVSLAAAAPTLSSRQQTSSQNTFVRRFYHGSFIVNKTLYIDGGEQTELINGIINNRVLNNTLAIDLSSSFPTTINSTLSITSIDKGDCPSFNWIQHWIDRSDGNKVYAYGGEYSYLHPWVSSATIPLEELWVFSPTASGGGSWALVDTSTSSFWSSVTRPHYGMWAYGEAGGFNLGGFSGSRGSQKTNINGYIPIPGLQHLNYTSGKWTNSSALGYSATGTGSEGGMAYVPTWGSQGILVVIGGVTSPSLETYTDSANLQSMTNISVYDVGKQKWYKQFASGDTPDQMTDFCTVGIQGGDNSTFEILVYGGQDQTTTTQTDHLYILSLPSFRWFKANYTSADPRIWHTCQMYGSQLLSVGGVNPGLGSRDLQYNTTDPYNFGIKVFNTANMSWVDEFDADPPAYTPPAAIQTYYASNSRYPSQWTQQGLKTVFEPSSSSSATPQSSKKSNHTAAIAGGVVGGVLGLTLLSGIWYFIARKYHYRRQQQGYQDNINAPNGANANMAYEVEARDTERREMEGNGMPMTIFGSDKGKGQYQEMDGENGKKVGGVAGPFEMDGAVGGQNQTQAQMDDGKNKSPPDNHQPNEGK
ncbi:MAG: hypothetical protein M1834_006978 [Cirrosporium novae-zelandiae]|nr:MAG: hypothetical protein M1834_006978 [Cirrosporium novae-zelandiae]